jgi:hypothetical protein
MWWLAKGLAINLPAAWTGPSGHVLSQPWIPADVLASFDRLIAVLDSAAPPGLATTRNQFKAMGQFQGGTTKFMAMSESERLAVALDNILNLRVELLVAAQLQQAEALVRIRSDTPDFDCQMGKTDFGVEATSRARPEVSEALHAELERHLEAGLDVHVALERTGELLFAEDPAVVAAAGDRVVAEISSAAGASAGQALTSGNVPIPELGLVARWTTGTGIGMAGTRVHYDAALMFTNEQWTHHWNMAALQVRDTVEKKGQKIYSAPSIVVVDVSRLGETSRLLSDEGIAAFQAVLDGCDLGNLHGALLVRSVLTAENLWPICSRLDTSAAVANSVALGTAAVLLGEGARSLIATG